MFSLRTWLRKLSCRFNWDLLIVAPFVSFREPTFRVPARFTSWLFPPTLKMPRREAGRHPLVRHHDGADASVIRQFGDKYNTTPRLRQPGAKDGGQAGR